MLVIIMAHYTNAFFQCVKEKCGVSKPEVSPFPPLRRCLGILSFLF